MRSTSYLEISTRQAQSSPRIRDFRQPLTKQSTDQKDQQNTPCQVATREPKAVLHLAKSKTYSKRHRQQPGGASDSLDQVHRRNDLAQDPLHPSHDSSQATPWTNPTAYPRARSTTWIANSASNLHRSPN